MSAEPTSNICGACTACCIHLAVETIGKAAGVACEHLCSAGCTVYSTRPDQCRNYGCIWYADQAVKLGLMRPMERPDKLGIILSATPGTSEFERESGEQLAMIVEVRPNATHEGNARRTIERISRHGLLILMRGDERKVIGPKDKVGKVTDFIKRKGGKL